MAVVGQNWRWDDSSLSSPQLAEYTSASAKANMVVRTRSDITTLPQAVATIYTGSRMGKSEGGWNLREALRSGSSGRKIGINSFGSKFVPFFGHTKDRVEVSSGGVTYPDAYFKSADLGVFASLVGEVAKPDSLTFIDATVFPPGRRLAMLEELMKQSRDQGWNLMAVSAADAGENGGGKPRLQVFAGLGSYFDSGTATSASTHRLGLIHLPDVTATILDYFGLSIPSQVKGQPIRVEGDLGVEGLRSMARRAALILPAQRFYIPVLSTFLSVVLIFGVWTLNRRTHPHLGVAWKSPRGLLRFWRVVGTWMALAPPCAFLMNLAPWWELGPTNTDVAAETFYWFGALLPFALAAVITFFWEVFSLGSWLSPLALVGVLSLVIGLLDPWVGSPMMLDSVMGTQSTIGGRFYGIDNMMFAIYITGALLIMTEIYGLASEKTRPVLLVVLFLVAIGVVAIDVIPVLGADFGGLLASLPAFMVFFAKLHSKRVNPLLWLATVLFTFVLAVLLAYFDWLRPPAQRTHLGNFVDSVREGRLGQVLWVKFTQLSTAGWNPWVVWGTTLIFFVGIALLAWPLFLDWRVPYRRDYAWLLGSAGAANNPEGIRFSTEEKAFIWAWLTAMVLGMLLNDSTVLIGLVGFTVATPALLAQVAYKYLLASGR